MVTAPVAAHPTPRWSAAVKPGVRTERRSCPSAVVKTRHSRYGSAQITGSSLPDPRLPCPLSPRFSGSSYAVAGAVIPGRMVRPWFSSLCVTNDGGDGQACRSVSRRP
jgi:hypothetical protein